MSAPLKRKAADVTASSAKKTKGNASITSFFSSPSTSSKPAASASSAPASSAPPSSPLATKDDASPAQSQTIGSSAASSTTVTGTTAPAASIFNKAKDSTLAAGQASAPAIKFDKAKWVEKLTPEQKDLLALEIEYLHESWLGPLKDEITSPSFLELKRFLKREHEGGKKIFPPAPDVYSWLVKPCFLSNHIYSQSRLTISEDI